MGVVPDYFPDIFKEAVENPNGEAMRRLRIEDPEEYKKMSEMAAKYRQNLDKATERMEKERRLIESRNQPPSGGCLVATAAIGLFAGGGFLMGSLPFM